MCGIAGYSRTGATDRLESWQDWLVAAADAVAHRGPDDLGYYRGPQAAMAVRRLALVDLVHGGQPLCNERQDVWLACNGEIYNHRTLREELRAQGHIFRTGSDVEVIVHLYEESGIGLLDRLDGQFAFALHDTQTGTTYLARDHFGICPLFYAQLPGGFVFASEIAGVLAHPRLATRLDPIGLDQVFNLPGLISPQTMFQGVHSVPAGHYCQMTRSGMEMRRYWDLDYPREPSDYLSMDMEEMAGIVLAVMADSVRSRLAADVPVGAYLSGGLDSSVIAAVAAAVTGGPLPATFSVGYEDLSYDESAHAEAVAELVSGQHLRTVVSLADVAAGLPVAVYHSAAPLRESYNVASLHLSRLVREAGFKAVVGGEGADELFAGYPGYRFDKLRDTDTIDGRIPAGPEADLRERAWGDPSLRYEHDLSKLRNWTSQLYGGELRAAVGAGFLEEPLVNAHMLSGRHRLHQRSYLDVKLRLADHLLGDHGDRMAMANAVEVRYPFLSRAVAELAVRMPPDMKLDGLEDKAVIRRAAKRVLPGHVARREKFSWAAHGSSGLLREGALGGAQREMVEYLVSPAKIKSDGLFDAQAVARLRARQIREPEYDPNGVPDFLMVVMTTGLFMDAYKVSL
jgi:asparagine synthase (glutamine-hydrolysing)